MSRSRDSRMGLPPSIVSKTANSRARSCSSRATLYRYLARSAPGRSRQPPSHAARAAATARSTSPTSATLTSASASPVAGFTVAAIRPAAGSTISPPMNRPYCEARRTGPTDSGAGAYSRLKPPTGSTSCLGVGRSVKAEILPPLVAAVAELGPLHEHVVEQAGRSQPEPFRGQPSQS